MFNSYAVGDAQDVITVTELAVILDVDQTDPVLPSIVQMATSMAIEYLERELIDRDRVLIYEHWPITGTDTTPSLSRNNARFDVYIPLPYATFATVNSVEVYGDTYTDYRVVQSSPVRIYVDQLPTIGNDDNPAIKIEYTAGYGPLSGDVPKQIKGAVLALAAYLYEHRGACDAGKALNDSGAALALTPFKMNAVNI